MTIPSSPPTTAPEAAGRAGSRLLVLDVVRGAALCGILFANVGPITGVVVPWADGEVPLTTVFEQVLVGQRFFPIFSLLFGVGFGMLWATAGRRTAQPRVALLRRLLVLGVFGGLHHLLQPGEALLPYAIVGIVVLLPLTWLPYKARLIVAGVGGVVLTVAGAMLGGVAVIPGMFLLGFAAALADLPRRVENSPRLPALLTVVAGVLAVPFIVIQLGHPKGAGFDVPSAVAGLLSGLCLVGILGVLLHTPVRAALGGFFAPLGKMALTNYIGATVICVLVSLPLYEPLTFLTGNDSMMINQAQLLWIWGACVLLLVLQSLVSRIWLARFGQGPLERLWRWATWTGTRPARDTTSVPA